VHNKKAHRFEDIFVGESVNTPGFIIVEDTRESYSQKLYLFYTLWGIAFSHIFDYNANYSNVISRFSYEAIGLSHWNTKVFMIKLIEVVTTMSAMRNHHTANLLPHKHTWVRAYHLVPEVYERLREKLVERRRKETP